MNTYKKQYIEQLHHIKRISSSMDIYDNEASCLLEDLLNNKKLEYVDICSGENMYAPILLK